MDEIISQPEETRETGEKAESTEARKLDEATFEPKAHVERTGDYKQSEAIQTDFTSVVNNAASSTQNAAIEQDKSVSGQQPKVRDDLEQAKPVDSDDDGKLPATPIPLPGTADVAHVAAESAALEQNESVLGQQPTLRGDLEQAKPADSDDDDDKPGVTPINLPGVQNLENPDVAIQDLTQNKLGKDPLTGDEFGGQSGGSEQKGQEAMAGSEASGDYSLEATPAEQVSDETKDRSQAQLEGNMVADGELDDPAVVGQTPQGEGRLIPENLPQMEKNLIAEGTNGMLEGSSPGTVHSGPIKGYGPGYEDGPHSTKVPGSDFEDGYKDGYTPGSSSSKSGPPVHGYGPGAVGEVFIHDVKDKSEADKAAQKIKDTFGGKCVQGTLAKVICKTSNGDYIALNYSNTIDGVSPIPYTGSGSWGEKPKPQVIGGADQESGHFNAVVSVNGKMVGGSSGGEPGTSGDEGHWYGGLFASADRPNNPDDPDYYTPNVLDEADKAKKTAL